LQVFKIIPVLGGSLGIYFFYLIFFKAIFFYPSVFT